MKAEILLWESYLVFQDNKLELYISILLLKEERNASARPYKLTGFPFDPKSHPIKNKNKPQYTLWSLYGIGTLFISLLLTP